MGEILTVLGGVLSGVMLVAYRIEKQKGIQGVTCALLCAAAIPFWLIVFYSVYLLVGDALELFGQPRAPYLIRVLWPESLLPYAPLVASILAWWETALFLPYWIKVENETQEERRDRLNWYLKRVRRSSVKWLLAYAAFWVVIQIWYRVPFFATIELPAPLP